MQKPAIRLVLIAALALLVIAGAALRPGNATSRAQIGNKIYAHKLAVVLGKEPARGKEMPLSSGILYTLMQSTGVIDQRVAKWAQTPQGRAALNGPNAHGISDNKTEGCQNQFHGHGQTNTRVNQDCSFRRQAEEMIQLNPLDEKNIIAGPERLADRLQPLRIRLVVRRRQELGRPASAVLAVRPARRPHRGRM